MFINLQAGLLSPEKSANSTALATCLRQALGSTGGNILSIGAVFGGLIGGCERFEAARFKILISITKLGLRPYTVTRKEAKELLQPSSYVDRLVYAATNYTELGWLEILPEAPGRERRETYIVLESLDRAFERIRRGEVPPEQPWLAKGSNPKRKLRKKKSS